MNIANFLRPDEIRQLCQRSRQHCFMTISITGRAKCSSHRMIDEASARRRDSSHDVVRRADNQGWYSVTFYNMGDETDGLVAEGSIGHQQSEIDADFT
jgi:flavin-binding protein dodecin